jgi:WD40 repeat protein/tRNA A-37 threonylcarbamoyl transferase component Bud32
MASVLSEPGRPRRLIELLAPGAAWPLDLAIPFVRRLAEEVQQVHASGRLHGAIDVATIPVDRHGSPRLPASPAVLKVGGEWFDAQLCPPELADVEAFDLNPQLSAAKEELHTHGQAIDARRIDLYQLGTVMCRLLTGESIESYLYHPSLKGRVPEAARPVLSQMLGFDGDERVADCELLIAALGQIELALAREVGSKGRSTDTTVRPTGAGKPRGRPAAASRDRSGPAAGNPPTPELPLTHLGSCRLLAQIGQGGMGDVYKAQDESLDRLVAIKVLPPQMARDQDFVRRFRAEASAIARLVHPNVVQVYSIGEDQGHHYFVMQFVEGESLAQRLRRQRRLDVDDAVNVFEQCLTGLAAAHDEGLIHRDIKPGNILLDARSGRALLADFGLVKKLGNGDSFTATGMILGTVDYLSPEQGRGLPVDARSDLYSMGVLLYEMLSGRLPFKSESPTAMVFQHAYEQPCPLCDVAPDVPHELQEIVARLLKKDPAQRYPTAHALLDDVKAFRAGRPLTQWRPQRSEIRRAPQFDSEPALPATLPLPAEQGRWQRLQERARSIVRRHTPEFVKELQTTTQQVDGAIAEYARRREKLARLLAEGQQVLAELTTQIDEELAAANSQIRSAEKADTEGSPVNSTGAAAGLERLVSLRVQRDQQQQAIADMELMLAKVDARLSHLRTQRDLLHARLKTVDAQQRLAGRRRTPPMVSRIALVAAAGVMCLGLIAVFRLRTPSVETKVAEIAATPPVNTPPLGPHARVVKLAFVANARGEHRFFVDNLKAVTEYRISDDGRITRGSTFDLQDKPDVVTWSPDGQYVATAGRPEPDIQVWELSTAHAVHRLVGHTKPVVALAFSPDGERLASASLDGTLRLWEVASETELANATLASGTETVDFWRPFQVVWSPNGSQLAAVTRTYSSEKPGFTTFDGQSLELLRRVTPSRAAKEPAFLAYAASGRQIVTLLEGRLVMWDTDRGEEVRSQPGEFRQAAVSTGSTRLMTVDRFGANVWETSSDMLVARLPEIPRGLQAIDISHDGAWAAGLDYQDMPHAWRLPESTAEGQLQLFNMGQPVRCAVFSPDGFLTAWNVDREIDVWDIQRPPQDVLAFGERIRTAALAFSADARRLAFATAQPSRRNNEVRVREIVGWGVGHRDTDYKESRWAADFGDMVTSVAWLPDGKRLAMASRDGTLRIAEMGRDDSRRFDLTFPINAMAVFTKGERAVVAGDDPAVKLIDLTGKADPVMFAGHTHFVYTVAISADGNWIASGGDDRTVRVWNTESTELVATLTGHSGRVNAVAFLPKGHNVVSGSDDGTVRFWDVSSASEQKRIEAHTAPVRAVAVNWDGGRLLSAGDDGTVRLWDLRKLKQ